MSLRILSQFWGIIIYLFINNLNKYIKINSLIFIKKNEKCSKIKISKLS